MKRFVFCLAWAFALMLASSFAHATVVEHIFNVEDISVKRLCREQVITAVNGTLPGPTINVREGDTLVVHVFNKSPYNLTIHWHGILQLLTPWSDGPEFVTQCPIDSGSSFTYKFNVTGQEGTLWWHAHSSFLRATVYGALIIRPSRGHSYPFPKVYQELPPILLGEWWNDNVVEVERRATENQTSPDLSAAYTINGLPSDLYDCSQDGVYKLKVKQGKTYLLRIINAALNAQHFFKIANHTLTVVAIDAAYTKHYNTNVVVLAPGQTVDVLFNTNQRVGSYYMVFIPYNSAPNVTINENMTRGVVIYEGATSSEKAIMPDLPAQTDTPTAHKFYTNITGLAGGPHWVPVPRHVDEHMFITFGISYDICRSVTGLCPGPGPLLSANMNNESFVLPRGKGLSMLEAFYYGKVNVNGVYTRDFPNRPPFEFDYTDPSLPVQPPEPFNMAPKSTKVKTLKFNSTVEIVLQNTAIIAPENHPIHIHGFNFHVLAQGFGNYNASRDEPKFNFVNPQIRNTISVPVGGWSVIRFQANNPGIWLVHCHLETHLPWGLAMAFEVENGPTPSSTVPPPPADLPKC